jgi:hypothetical protein
MCHYNCIIKSYWQLYNNTDVYNLFVFLFRILIGRLVMLLWTDVLVTGLQSV